jgi:hypothetical protein
VAPHDGRRNLKSCHRLTGIGVLQDVSTGAASGHLHARRIFTRCHKKVPIEMDHQDFSLWGERSRTMFGKSCGVSVIEQYIQDNPSLQLLQDGALGHYNHSAEGYAKS